jgi:hypothetical protein
MKKTVALFVLAAAALSAAALAALLAGPTTAQGVRQPPNGPVSRTEFKALTKSAVFSYLIHEHTRNERLAHSGGFVIRWKPTTDVDQRFVFHPLANGKFRIESQRTAMSGRKWLGIADGVYDGRLITWTKADNNTQEFTIEWNSDDTFMLKEPTKGEYVTVSPNGDVIRWSRHTDPVKRAKEQHFRLFAYRWHAFLPAR